MDEIKKENRRKLLACKSAYPLEKRPTQDAIAVG